MRCRSALFLVVALLALSFPSSGASVQDVLSGFPMKFDWLSAEQFSSIPGISDGYSAHFDAPLLGGVDAYVYAIDTGKPIVALVLPKIPDELGDLTSAFGIEVTSPVLFWVKEAGDLTTASMPAPLATHVTTNTGMPLSQHALAGINLFGRFSASSSLDALHLPKLCLGFAKKEGTSLVTMALPSGSSWENPFQLPSTTVKSGVVYISSTAGIAEIEAWATAKIAGMDNDVTMYVEHDGKKLTSAGFDTESASLGDVVAILGVLGDVVKLPKVPTPPGDVVKLSNFNSPYQQYSSARPDFAKMMFQANLSEDANAALHVNAKGEIFGVSVAAMKLNASASGVSLEVPAECPLRPVGLKIDLTASGLPVQSTLEDCFSKAIGEIIQGVADISTEAYDATAGAATTAANLGAAAATDVAKFTGQRAAAWASALGTAAAPVNAAASAQAAFNTAVSVVKGIENLVSDLGGTILKLAGEIEDLWDSVWGWVEGAIADKEEEKATAEADLDAARTRLADANLLEAQTRKNLEDAQKGLSAVAGANLDENVANLGHEVLAATAKRDVQVRVAEYATQLQNNKAEVLKAAAPHAQALLAETTSYFGQGVVSLEDAVQRRESLATFKKHVVEQAVSSLVETEASRALEASVGTLPTMAFDLPVRIMTENMGCLATGAGTAELVVRNCAAMPDEIFIFKADGRLEAQGTKSCVRIKANVTEPGLAKLESSATCDLTQAGQFFFDPVDGMIRFLVKVPEPSDPRVEIDPMSIPSCLVADAGGSLSAGCFEYRLRFWVGYETDSRGMPTSKKKYDEKFFRGQPATRFLLRPADEGETIRLAGARDGSSGPDTSTVTNLSPLKLPPVH